MKRKYEEGNVLTIATIFFAIAIVIFTFVIAIFMSHINSVLYNLKLDMYSINRGAILAVNKNVANMDKFSYNERAYKEEFINGLKSNYKLDDNLKNEEKLISSIEIVEYDIYEPRKRDSFTKERVDGRTIHTVLEVKIKPIILKSILEDIFVFTIHEDVALNMASEYS